LGFGSRGLGCGAYGSGFRVQGSGFRVQGFAFGVQGAGFRVQGSGFGVQGAGFRVQGLRFRVVRLGLCAYAVEVRRRGGACLGGVSGWCGEGADVLWRFALQITPIMDHVNAKIHVRVQGTRRRWRVQRIQLKPFWQVYYKNSLMLLVKNMRCSKLHCEKGFDLILISYRVRERCGTAA